MDRLLCIPLGSYLMCFRFLQVAWAFAQTGELPHHDVAHVEGIEQIEDINPYALPDNLHPADLPGGKMSAAGDPAEGRVAADDGGRQAVARRTGQGGARRRPSRRTPRAGRRSSRRC